MNICIVGTGYVGLVTGACLADLGHQVVCVDVDPEKIRSINSAQAPIYEAGLDELLARNAGTRLTGSTKLGESMADAEVVLICVGTPFDGRSIDLSYILEVASAIGSELRERDEYCVVAVKSTVVPGTTVGPVRDALESTSGKTAGPDFGLGMNPEFLAEGTAVKDFTTPDRIVVGGIDSQSTDVLARMYSTFESTPLLRTNLQTAEMIKYASNAFMATVISFSNEIADFCESTPGVDVTDVMAGVHEMKQLNVADEQGNRLRASASNLLWAGCGFGGSCFPKDVKALAAQAEQNGTPADLLNAVLRINERRPAKLTALANAHFDSLENLPITVLGLAFKPGTDDVRESPALKIVAELVSAGAQVTCHDPVALETGKTALIESGVPTDQIVFCDDLQTAVSGASAVVLVTSWPEYSELHRLIDGSKRSPLVLDGRRILSRDAFSTYAGIGLRSAVN